MPPPLKRDGLPTTKGSGVYVITNERNGKVYVGSAASLRGRTWYHRHALRKGLHYNKHLQAAWNRYGEASFRFNVLEACEVHLLREREQCWIDAFDAANPLNGYNKAPVAGSQRGVKYSDEVRAKMSRDRKGQDTSRATAAAAEANRRRKYPPKSAETKAKMSAAAKARHADPKKRAEFAATHWTKRPDAAEITARIEATKRERGNFGGNSHKLAAANATTQPSGTQDCLFAATASVHQES